MANNEPHDPAMGRYYMLQLVRVGAMGLVLLGVLTIAGRIGLPQELGYGIFIVGVFAFFYGPRQLARKWKSDGDR